ncbi:MAG: CDGSH iron-sulfur domain-containing protein [Phycisphaerales bacterium]|nr:CDGSH iron-sulfur domain-containing protein [Phycisphaerales bacterium]
MPRLVRHDQTGPYRIDPSDFPKDGKALFICACGLSSRMPICDGTHKGCRDEEPGSLYIYEGGSRRRVRPPEPSSIAPDAPGGGQ